MAGQQVLWVTERDYRPDSVPIATLYEASTEADALTWIESLEDDGERLDAVVAAPGLPDGDGPSVLRSVRDRWPEAVCILYGDLWEVPHGSSPPVCEFHPASQTPQAVAEAVTDAVRGRYHRSYPVFEDEDRRLSVLETVDAEAARPELESILSDVRRERDVSIAAVLLVDDYTVDVVARSEPIGPTEISRGDTVSAYAVGNGEPTIVPDAETDGRISHVVEDCGSRYRSYAALPLWVDDVPVGTLCVLDEDPDVFSLADEGALLEFAARAQDVLDETR